MTGRTSSRRRSKPQRLIDSEELEQAQQAAALGSRSKRSKAKTIDAAAGLDQTRSETPNSSRSRLSTPNSSRATSRSPTPTKSAKRSKGKSAPSRASSRKKKTPASSSSRAYNGGRASGSATPLSRASRSSSVSSSRKKAKTASPKVKTKIGRGYNPALVNYKESEYHYGSDFDESEDDYLEEEDVVEKDSETSDNNDGSSDDDKMEESDEFDAESDVDWTATGGDQYEVKSASRASTPIPFWLKTEDEEAIPDLKLPKSSDDLLINAEQSFKAAGIYEVLRHYYLILRLSLFRFEDFCAALASEEQSNLLSEVHIALLKAIVRAEEKDNTQWGPMDHKDSINALFFFNDSMTWPEALRQFLASDPVANAEPLAVLTDYPEYPVQASSSDGGSKSFIDARIQLLNFMSDQFLTTNAVREDIANEGALPTEDHCRVCYRLGEMVVCEMCSGVYHLGCLEPPLDDVPEYDWQCYVCQAHQIKGVIDCVDDQEKSGTKIRHQALGFDRSGNKYWFLCRRLFVEEASNQIRYYSSVPQFEELLDSLDSKYFEQELCAAIEVERAEIERQMLVTENLTAEKKANSKKSYLELENQNIVKAQEEREEKQLQEDRERREAADAIIRQAKEEEDAKRRAEDEERAKKEEEKRREREERLRKREENRGDTFPDLEDGVIKEEEVVTDEQPMEVTEETVVKTEQVKDEIKEEEVKTEPSVPVQNKQTIIVKPPPEALLNNEPVRMTRRTVQEINQGTLYFKLGQEGSFKSYINQFTSNPSALSKVQANEERVKRTHMSHKFSLTEASTFRWMGQLYGTRHQLVNTLRQTILQLESSLPLIFMHCNWHLMRKPWIQALNTSNTPKDFARALTVLQCCIKPCLMVNVWYESLGHTQLKKFTQQMKDDRRKNEKRERKELEDEAERLRPFMTFVKYTLGLKHTVSKQRGEEYRAHGQQGWLWLSRTRRFTPCDARTVGLRAGPHRLAVKYTDTRNNSFKIVLMEPKAFKYLVAKQESMETSKENQDASNDSAETDKIGIEKKKLEQALKNARLEHQVPGEELFKDVVDVSQALQNPTRILYPKVAKKATHLDDFLARRLQLKSLEERRIELKYGAKANEQNVKKDAEAPVAKDKDKAKANGEVDTEGESDTKTSITSDLAEKTKADKERDYKKYVEQAKKSIWNVWIPKLNNAVNEAKTKVEHRPAELKCYSANCNEKGCYSMTCANFKPISPAVREIKHAINAVVADGKIHGIDLTNEMSITQSPEEAINTLRNLVKTLMKTKDDTESDLSIGISAVSVPSSTAAEKPVEQPQVNGEKKAESNDANAAGDNVPNVNRVYSNSNASGKLYLKRIQTVAESKKQSKIIKYPMAPSFHSASRRKKNILILAKHDAKRLSRRAGFVTCEGFNYSSKANNQVWPYPCPRPTFKTSWLYRTACLTSIQTVGMQLRTLWACIRWDDLHTKSNSIDGKHQETSDSAITTTEIIKHRHTGRFQEVTEYYQRKVTIPLDVPKTKTEITPIRSGLRKRKREEAPQQTEPEVLENWIPEEKLELWEIRAYRDRLERDRNAAVTRTRTGAAMREPQRFEPSSMDQQRRQSVDLKAKMEDQLKQQQSRSVLVQAQPPAQQQMIQQTTAPTIIRRIQNPDGTISIIRTTMNPNTPSPVQAQIRPTQQQQVIQPGTKKVFLSKDGKIIGAQIVQQPTTAATSKISIPSVGGMQNPVATPTVVQPQTPQPAQQQQQKVQIVRSSDGKIQVRGLLPGQQLVQMPDGKLQIFSQPTAGTASNTTASPTVVTSTAASPSTPVVNSQPSRIVVHPGGTSSTVTSSPTVAKPAVNTPTKSIVATPLQPGQAIPQGTTVFMSGGKTYCIPKATITMAAQQQQQQTPPTNTTPALPVTPLPPQQLDSPAQPAVSTTTTPTIGTAQTQSVTGQKQMVEVKSLGQNTVTLKGNQMIVSGPDIAQAQLIAKQLSSGAAKLATLNGKQVLISTQPTVIKPAASANNAAVTPTTTSNQGALPVQTEIPNNIKLPSEPLPPTAIKSDQAPVQQTATQVTAQLIQTPQGPRIVLQGIQGANLTKDQLQSIQQQVKEQLLKAQAEAKLQGKVPPTKIAIQLPQTMTAPSTPNAQVTATPATPVTPVNNVTKTPPTLTTARQVITTPSGQRVIVMGSASGQKQVVTVPSSTSMTPVTPNNIQQSLLMSSLTSPKKQNNSPEKFELTQDYIQQTIQQALKKDNLSPEIEQKLLAMQQNAVDKTVIIKKKNKPIDPATGEPMDDEWDGSTSAERSIAHKNRRKKQEEQVIAERTAANNRTPSAAALARSVNRTTAAVPKTLAPITNNTLNEVVVSEEKKRQLLQQKVQSALLRHKEQLKRDISKKRSMQEIELQNDIAKNIEKIKGNNTETEVVNNVDVEETIENQQVANDVVVDDHESDPDYEDSETGSLKRKRRESDETNESSPASSVAGMQPPKNKKKRRSSGQQPGSVKRDKLYCICKTRYDPKKFYVGCDVCSNWFHGSCVGINESMAKTMSEYICDECRNARENREIYCVCQQPYDETQFYIGCEKCSDWFHGRCVGILQSEANHIDEYLCPNCCPGSKLNVPNQKRLNADDYEVIKKLVKQLWANRASIAFQQPVNPSEVPNYYKVVKEPMDLSTVEKKVNNGDYKKLCEFIGDVMRIFENCRFFNQPNSSIMKSADSLEAFFAQKLSALRDKIGGSAPNADQGQQQKLMMMLGEN